MKIEDEEAALQTIRDNARNTEEKIQLMALFKDMLPNKREDLWRGLYPDDFIGVLRTRLGSGGLGPFFLGVERPLCRP